MNNVTLVGRLADNPRKGKNENSPVYFPIAVNSGKENVDFLDVTTFGKLSDNVLAFCKKGEPVCVQAHLKKQDKDHGYALVIIADRVEFMGGKKND